VDHGQAVEEEEVGLGCKTIKVVNLCADVDVEAKPPHQCDHRSAVNGVLSQV